MTDSDQLPDALLIEVNDALSSLVASILGRCLDDDVLNDLTHRVARAILECHPMPPGWVEAQPYEARLCTVCDTWIYTAAGPFAEGDPTKTMADILHYEAHALARDGIGFPFMRFNEEPVRAIKEPEAKDSLPINTDDNPHEIDPATGKPWPIEPLCCSYHYPLKEEEPR